MAIRTETIVAKHLKQSVLQNRAVVGVLIFIYILLFYALFLGWKSYTTQNNNSSKFQEQSRKDWLQNPDKNPHRMAHYGNYAFRKSTTLSIFEPGMSDFFGNVIYLEAHKQNTANFSEASTSSSLLRFGSISVAFVLQMLLPLLIFFIGFDCIASDRENGSLRLILTQGISWKQLLLGKILGLLKVVLLLYIPMGFVLFLIWFWTQNGVISFDETIKISLFLSLHLLYLLIFCVLAVLISAVSKTSKKALISLIGLWVILFIILPRGTQALGSYFYPAVSKIKFNAQIDRDILNQGDSHNPNDTHFKAIKDSLLLVHKVDSVHKLPFNFSGFIMTKAEKISSKIYNEHLESVLEIYAKQNSFSKAAAFFNPYMTIKNITMALSNTDYGSYINFQKQAESYRYEMAQKMNELQIKYISNKKQEANEKPYAISKKYWESLNNFENKQNSISTILQNELVSFVSLISCLCALMFVLIIATKNLKAI